MNDLFELKYPDLNIVVKYEFYLNYFKENFGYQFGRPQVTCEELNKKNKVSNS